MLASAAGALRPALTVWPRVARVESTAQIDRSHKTTGSKLAACKTLASKLACSRLSTLQSATGPKRSMGHFLGARNSFAVRRRTRPQGGRASEILSNRGPEVSLGAPRVATRRAQAPTPHARRLPSVHTYKQGPLRSTPLDHDLPKFSIQSSLGSPENRRIRRRRLPDPRPIPEGVREPIYIHKK